MNLPPSAAAPAPPSSAPGRNWPRLLVNAAVTLVVLAVAAATFVLSYAGVHAIALQGGVSVQLARIYPGLFDAVLVIACVAAVVLRDGRWWARCWAWLVVIVILGAIGTTDVLHAANYALRHRTTEGVVAAAPVVAVLLAFSLLLTLLRQSRPQAPDAAPGPRGRAARRAAAQQSTAPALATSADATRIDIVAVDAVPVVAAGAVARPPAPPIALPPVPEDSEAVSTGIAETQVMPAYSGDAGEHSGDAGEAAEAGRVPPDPVAASTREEAALTPEATVTPEVVETPDAPETSDTPMVADTSEAADSPVAADSPLTADSPVAADNPAVDEQNPPAEPTEPIEAVIVATPSAADGEPDAYADDPDVDEPPAEPTQAPRPSPQAIRYASSAVSESAAEYWESEVDPDLAGQVYPVLTSDPDIDTSDYPTGEPQDVETDAPPFATAPFASVPRLNRMRVTPIPPTDEDDES